MTCRKTPDSDSADPLREQVCQFILEHRLIEPGSHIVAAVSGGADSLALLHLLHGLRQDLSFSLSCLHIHHGLRGPEADRDCSFVEACCQRLAIPFQSRAVAVSQLAAEKHQGLEMAAREARRAIFRELADANAAAGRPIRIALAHHLDDQAETVLLHLGRGAGLDGLVGMRPLDGFMIRPLLACRRRELERYLESRALAWCHDQSNDEDFTIRNRLRHQVLPTWQAALGYDPVVLLGRAAANLAGDQDFLELASEKQLAACLRLDALDAAGLRALHPALQARVMRRYWRLATGHGQDLGRKHVLAWQNWLDRARSGQQLDLPHGHVLSLEDGLFRIRNRPDPAAAPEAMPCPVPLVVPSSMVLAPCQVRVTAAFVENDQEIVYNGAVECFWFDRIRTCVWRTRMPGDRIHPVRRQVGKPLKKYLQERHVPAAERDHCLVLADGAEIAWVPGHDGGEPYVVRPGDQGEGRKVMLRLEKTGEKRNGCTGRKPAVQVK